LHVQHHILFSQTDKFFTFVKLLISALALTKSTVQECIVLKNWNTGPRNGINKSVCEAWLNTSQPLLAVENCARLLMLVCHLMLDYRTCQTSTRLITEIVLYFKNRWFMKMTAIQKLTTARYWKHFYSNSKQGFT
jgi:hypothetical protein